MGRLKSIKDIPGGTLNQSINKHLYLEKPNTLLPPNLSVNSAKRDPLRSVKKIKKHNTN